MPAVSLAHNDSNEPLAETVTPDGKYRYRYFEGDVVGIQKYGGEGWSTAYVFRDGVCPCIGHQYRGNCQHKPIAQALIRWWHDVGAQAAPAPAETPGE
jgi:hypothetical protein